MFLDLPSDLDAHIARVLRTDEGLVHKFTNAFGDFAVNLVVAAIILVVTFWAARWISGLMRRGLDKWHGKRAPDATLVTFISSLTRYVVMIVGLVAVLQQLGVQTTSILAVLGAASLAVGLALQGTLSNVAAGVMLLMFRPYRVGDFIETSTRKGTVKSLDLFVTELATADNLKVVIPNGKVFGDVIINYNFNDRRRVDATFRLPLAANLTGVMEGLVARAKADPRVLEHPAPMVEVTGMAEAWVEGVLRAWTLTSDHAAVLGDQMLAARLLAMDPPAPLPPLPKAPATPKPAPKPRRPRLGRGLLSGHHNPQSPPKDE